MTKQDTDRVAEVETRVAELEAALTSQRNQTSGRSSERQRVSRRQLMYTGGAVAAGAVLASGKPAAAQQQVPASDVTFVPAGDIASTNVQNALEEVDLEKAALAGAAFTGPTSFPDATFAGAAKFVSGPWVDIRAHGAEGDGSTDDTAAIKRAITWIQGAGDPGTGGTVLIPPGVFRFTEPITIPEGVDIWGCGGHPKAGVPSVPGTVLKAGHGSAQLIIEGEGGQSGNFLLESQFAGIDADVPETGLLYLSNPIERIFTALRVGGARKDGILATKMQNCTFLQLHVSRCRRDGLIVDSRCDNNIFIRAELTQCARDNLVIRHSDQTLNAPLKNQFIKCLIERGDTSQGPWQNSSMLHVTGGFDNLFTFCGFHPQTPTQTTLPSSDFLAILDGDCFVMFDNCQFGSNADGIGALHASGNSRAEFQGHCVFATGNAQNQGKGIVWDSTGRVLVAGVMDFRENPGWEVSTQRHHDLPFEMTFTRLNALEGAGMFVPKVDDAQAAIYVRNNQLVVAYQDGAGIGYRTMPLTGTSTTWNHSTSPP